MFFVQRAHCTVPLLFKHTSYVLVQWELSGSIGILIRKL